MIKPFLSILPALACALLAQAVQAQSPSQPQGQSKSQSQPPAPSKPQQPPAKSQQESQGGFLYKSTMPDGKVMYGDGPMPGAVKVEKTRPDTSKKGITAATPKEKEALKKMEAERTAGGGGRGVQDVDGALRAMEADRERAKEPLPGERTGTAGGGSRLNDAYWERQKRLDATMEAMRKDLEKSRTAK